MKSSCLMFTLQSQEQQCTSIENAVAWTVRIRRKSYVHLDVEFAFQMAMFTFKGRQK